MPYEFDLKKFLAQHSNIEHDDLMAALTDDAEVPVKMTAYLEEVQSSGFLIEDQYLTRPEISMLVAMCIGQSTHTTMERHPEEYDTTMALLQEHKGLLFTLVACAVACGIGIAAKEEWR